MAYDPEPFAAGARASLEQGLLPWGPAPGASSAAGHCGGSPDAAAGETEPGPAPQPPAKTVSFGPTPEQPSATTVAEEEGAAETCLGEDQQPGLLTAAGSTAPLLTGPARSRSSEASELEFPGTPMAGDPRAAWDWYLVRLQ